MIYKSIQSDLLQDRTSGARGAGGGREEAGKQNGLPYKKETFKYFLVHNIY